MAGMMSLASRTIPRRIFRIINTTLDGEISLVSTRQIHNGGSKVLRRMASKLSNNGLRTKNSYMKLEIRQLHCTPAMMEIVTVKVPAFADSVSEGDVRWEKKKGDHVAEDEVVLEIETDKTSMPVQAPGHGIIEECLVADGATVKPGMDLFRINVTGQKPAGAPAKAASPPPRAASPPPAAAPPPPRAPSPPPATATPPPAPKPAAPAPPAAAPPPPYLDS